MNNSKISKFVVTSFVTLFLIVSFISTIHSITFFLIANEKWMSIFLAIAFEVGQLSALAAILVPNRLDMRIVWGLFIILTLFQIMNNVYYSFVYMQETYKQWCEMFGLSNWTDLNQKRIVAFVQGGFLPILSIGFSKSLVDYLKEHKEDNKEIDTPLVQNDVIELVEDIKETNIEIDVHNKAVKDAYINGKDDADFIEIPLLTISRKDGLDN